MDMNLKGIMQTLGAKPGQVVSNPYVRAFAPQPTITEGDGEDHEVSMANNSIDTIIKMATELKAKMGEDEKQIPAWIQDHIAKAENLISQASGNYHEYGDSNESVNEAVDFKDGKYRFYSKDGVGYLTYDGKELSSGDFDWEDGSNSYWMYHSSWGGQKAFDTGKDVIAYFKKNKIVKESVNEAKVFVHNEKTGEKHEVLSGKGKGDLIIAMKALEKAAPSHMKYSIKESVNEVSYNVKADNAYQFINGAYAVLGMYLKDEKLESGVKSTLQRVVKDLEGLRKYFFSRKDESVNTSLRLTKLK